MQVVSLYNLAVASPVSGRYSTHVETRMREREITEEEKLVTLTRPDETKEMR